MSEKENKLKSIDIANLQGRIAGLLEDFVQEKYQVNISKIEYTKTGGAKIQLEVSAETGGLTISIRTEEEKQ